MGKVDKNNRYVALAAEDKANPLPVPIKVDASTGRVLVEIYSVDEPASSVLHTKTSVDKNNRQLAFADDGNGNAIPLHIDSRNGYLFCDVNIE